MVRTNLAKRPSIERLRQYVAYDPATGVFAWLITSGRAIAGQEAGARVDKDDGYRRIRIDGSIVLAHHAAFAWVHGRWPERLDHRNGDKADCRIRNLRECTQAQNMANQGRPITNRSGVKGVCWHKASGLWQAQLGKQYLGVFKTIEEAAAAYEKAAIATYGEFARGVDFVKPSPAAREKKPRRRNERPTVDEVRDALSYDSATGKLKWRRALGFRGQIGTVAGRLNPDGYWRVGLFGKQYPAHVLAWVITHGVWPAKKIDHKNNIRDDNRLCNLREATQSQNIANALTSSRNTSGYRGVSYIAAEGKWGAWIKVDGVGRRIGSFWTKEQAYAAYCEEAKLAWGEFAKIE